MILASHVIIGAYGFWLPNDPRGSWSDFVGSWELFRFGPATRTTETTSVAHRAHDQGRRLAAKQALKRAPVSFTGEQARAIGRGFGKFAATSGLTVWACAILPEHIHLILARHRLKVESLVVQLKGAATRRLVEEQLHPFAGEPQSNGRPPRRFARGAWQVFLDSAEDIVRAIAYVQNNPIREGKPAQRWRFVVPVDPSVL